MASYLPLLPPNRSGRLAISSTQAGGFKQPRPLKQGATFGCPRLLFRLHLAYVVPQHMATSAVIKSFVTTSVRIRQHHLGEPVKL